MALSYLILGLVAVVCSQLSSVDSSAQQQHVFHMDQTRGQTVAENDEPKTANVFAFAKHFQNDMVLQRAPQRANIYGFSSDIEAKLVLIVEDTTSSKKEYYETTVKQGPEPGLGVWTFTLNPKAAGTTLNLKVEAEAGTLALSNVIFGDVWLCSGQSNMEFTVGMMERAKEEIADAHNYPNIRVFTASLVYSTTPLYDLQSVEEAWTKPNTKSIGGKDWKFFSAVCWLYGKNIHKELGVPIGLVDTDWGGTPVEAWSSPEALAKCNITSNPTTEEKQQMVKSDSFGQTGMVSAPQDDNSVLWNAMINPFLEMTIYGAIWYQGEADMRHPKVEHYGCTFPTMIDDWRARFHKASGGQTNAMFPFGFVQLSANAPDPSIAFGIPDIRWHQTADYGYVPNPRLQNVFMAVAMDLPGFDSRYGTIHPRDKTDVGFRLALSGLQYAYNKSQVCQYPFPTKAAVVGSRVEITYGHVKKLQIRDWTGFDLLCSPKSGSNSTESVWRSTSLLDNTDITVSLYLNVCPSGQEVTGLRYAWRESPCQFKKCAIYASVNELPGSQFVAYAKKTSNGQTVFDFDGPTRI